MTDKVCLDLFCGLGGFSAAFADAEDWRVVTVDIAERFDPDIRADVFELRPSDLLDALGEYDVLVILASPPCTDFSLAASRYEKIVDGEPRTDSARESVALVYHTIGLIKALTPDYWLLENPKGYLRQIIGPPETWVTWCQYGEDFMKPTDLWGDLPPAEYRRCSFGDGCHAYNTDGGHGGKGNCDVIAETAEERALVPEQFSEEIREATDAALAGTVREQATLGDVP